MLGGQKLVAVTTIEPGMHHFWSLTHFISKQAPQLRPLLNSAVLKAAVFVPYPWLYRFPYPHAPPAKPHTRFQSQELGKKQKVGYPKTKVGYGDLQISDKGQFGYITME